MTTLLIMGVVVVALLGLFKIATVKVKKIKNRFFVSACSDLENTYLLVKAEMENWQLPPLKAQKMFQERASSIIDRYCQHNYGGVESTPFKEYAFLKNLTERLCQKLEMEMLVYN